MASVTAGSAKEALPLAGRTVLDLVLDEAFAAGAKRAVVVSAREKGDIEPIVVSRNEIVDLRYQDEQRGLAHAIVSAGEFDEDALILLPDTVFQPAGASSPLACAGPGADGAILSQPVSDSDVPRYGILECDGTRIRRILEKPAATETASRLAIAARFLLSPRLLEVLREYVKAPQDTDEYDLTTGLNLALARGMKLVAAPTNARRFDCGSPAGYQLAVEAFGK